ADAVDALGHQPYRHYRRNRGHRETQPVHLGGLCERIHAAYREELADRKAACRARRVTCKTPDADTRNYPPAADHVKRVTQRTQQHESAAEQGRVRVLCDCEVAREYERDTGVAEDERNGVMPADWCA